MGGLTESLPEVGVHDDFWSWRETMYKVALSVDPEGVEDIAAMVYAEMLRFGYTSVVEFHYLHQDQKGRAYQEPAELSLRLIKAARKVGIKLLLVPVLYQKGNFNTPPFPHQRRFIHPTLDTYLDLIASCRAKTQSMTDIQIGTGIHSLRAVDSAVARELLNIRDSGPKHLHIAEQRREVEEGIQHLGRSPTRWLLDSVELNEQFFLVHGTHSTPEEIQEVALRGANLVLCPSTEGNLGDGFFPLLPFLGVYHGAHLGAHLGAFAGDFGDQSRGAFLLGTDSQIGLNPLEDLRWLDYVQRLCKEKRNPVCTQAGDDSGALLWSSLQKARLAAGDPNTLKIGDPLDALVINTDHPIFFEKPRDKYFSTLIYCCDASMFTGTMRRGEWLVHKGVHRDFSRIAESYKKTLNRLLAGT
jgi:formimidoylglutamate deiminase